MTQIIKFPYKEFPESIRERESYELAKKELEKRLGVTLWEFLGFEGNKEEVDSRINRSLRKETMRLTTKMIEEDRTDLNEVEDTRVPIWEHMNFKNGIRAKIK